MVHGDGLAWQQRRAPPETRRERDRRVLDFHQRVQDHLVERAVEVAAPVEQVFGDGQFLVELRLVGRTHLVDQRLHFRVRTQVVREHRQQLVAKIHHPLVLDIEVEHTEEFGVAAGIGDQGLAGGVLHDQRLRHAVVRVSAHDGVDAGDARGHLDVDIHAVVRQQDHRDGALGARLVDRLLHVLFLDAEIPVSHHVARIGDRRVGKRLPDDRHCNTVDLLHHIRGEYRVAEIRGLDVLRDEINPPLEIPVDDFLDALRTQRELPVPGHDLDAEQLAGIDHVLPLGPECCR